MIVTAPLNAYELMMSNQLIPTPLPQFASTRV